MSTKNKIMFVLGFSWVVGSLCGGVCVAEEWYENLESSTIKYTHQSEQGFDRKAVSVELVSDINNSRLAQNAWGSSSQMMIKPAEGG